MNSTRGGNEPSIDLILEQPITGERAMVQVKSAANASTLQDYIRRAHAACFDRLFFICHTPSGKLTLPRPGIHVWARDEIASRVITLGLQDWVFQKVA